MAITYCIHGATNNGDGTTSAEAGSPGGVGAYNSFVECLKNSASYTVAAGDTCYVKSSPAGAGGGDVSISTSATTTLAAGTNRTTGVRKFIIDDGTIWAQSGNIVWSCSGNVDLLTMGNFNAIIAPKDVLVLRYTNTSPTSALILASPKGSYMTGVKLIHGYGDNIESRERVLELFSDEMSFGHMTVELVGTPSISTVYTVIFAQSSTLVIDTLIIDSQIAHSTGFNIFTGTDDGASTAESSYIQINSGEYKGIVSDLDRLMVHEDSNFYEISNFRTEYLDFFYPGTTSTARYRSSVRASMCGGGQDFVEDNGYWRTVWNSSGGNYPTASAVLGDGTNDPWSILFWPFDASDYYTCPGLRVNKQWNAAAGQADVDLEFLVRDTFSNIDDSKFWIEVKYVDNDSGELVSESTRTFNTTPTTIPAGAGMDLWSALTYGSQTMDSYKISHTTVGDVKQNTDIVVMFFCSQAAPDGTSVGFIDPDPTFTAA